MKSVLNQTFEQDFETALKYEAFTQEICLQTQDHKEGLQAFFDKRQPKFTGK
jgi:2-(1,2-epoxy-1,2-dihydrophenyl)acetyl-CoA isomerase